MFAILNFVIFSELRLNSHGFSLNDSLHKKATDFDKFNVEYRKNIQSLLFVSLAVL